MSKTRSYTLTGDKEKDFIGMASNRTKMVLVSLQRLAKTGNRSNYAPNAAALDKIEAALNAQVKATMAALRNGYKGDSGNFSL